MEYATDIKYRERKTLC